jgi:hypothetical protein
VAFIFSILANLVITFNNPEDPNENFPDWAVIFAIIAIFSYYV